jgi:2-polyprenyl-3-methyl-5-hydroxy-6-metoxy-1,4-benzoquinol methylase
MTITPAEFLKLELEMGISADNPAFRELARKTAESITEPYVDVFDFGAGTGLYSNAFHELGKAVFAYEIWSEHRAYMYEKFPHLVQVNRIFTTDLLLMIEVAEHLTEEELRYFFSSVQPRLILFSSTPYKNPEFDAMWGHIHVLETEEWVLFFKELGYKVKRMPGLPTPWTLLLEKTQNTKQI